MPPTRSRGRTLGPLTFAAAVAATVALVVHAQPDDTELASSTELPSASLGDAAGGAGPEATAAREAARLASGLESWARTHGYPRTADEAERALATADLVATDGLVVGGYAYDADAVELALCLEDPASGAWAFYDTAPMTVIRSGADGGCPAL